MTLIVCSDCGGKVSDAAPACPHCGRPRRTEPKQKMGTVKAPKGTSNTVALLGALGVLAGLSGFGLIIYHGVCAPVDERMEGGGSSPAVSVSEEGAALAGYAWAPPPECDFSSLNLFSKPGGLVNGATRVGTFRTSCKQPVFVELKRSATIDGMRYLKIATGRQTGWLTCRLLYHDSKRKHDLCGSTPASKDEGLGARIIGKAWAAPAKCRGKGAKVRAVTLVAAPGSSKTVGKFRATCRRPRSVILKRLAMNGGDYWLKVHAKGDEGWVPCEKLFHRRRHRRNLCKKLPTQ